VESKNINRVTDINFHLTRIEEFKNSNPWLLNIRPEGAKLSPSGRKINLDRGWSTACV